MAHFLVQSVRIQMKANLIVPVVKRDESLKLSHHFYVVYSLGYIYICRSQRYSLAQATVRDGQIRLHAQKQNALCFTVLLEFLHLFEIMHELHSHTLICGRVDRALHWRSENDLLVWILMQKPQLMILSIGTWIWFLCVQCGFYPLSVVVVVRSAFTFPRETITCSRRISEKYHATH